MTSQMVDATIAREDCLYLHEMVPMIQSPCLQMAVKPELSASPVTVTSSKDTGLKHYIERGGWREFLIHLKAARELSTRMIEVLSL